MLNLNKKKHLFFEFPAHKPSKNDVWFVCNDMDVEFNISDMSSSIVLAVFPSTASIASTSAISVDEPIVKFS